MKRNIVGKILVFFIIGILNAGCADASSSGQSSKALGTGATTVSDVLKEATSESSNVVVKSPEPSTFSTTDSSTLESMTTNISVSDSTQEETETSPVYDIEPDESVDIDLTAMSSTMVYSEVYPMCFYPENYIGKTVKMDGMQSYYFDMATGNSYYACIITDATACCAQGIEFQLSDGNYPPEDTKYVAVKGVFDLYEEDGANYCTLRDAELVE